MKQMLIYWVLYLKYLNTSEFVENKSEFFFTVNIVQVFTPVIITVYFIKIFMLRFQTALEFIYTLVWSTQEKQPDKVKDCN